VDAAGAASVAGVSPSLPIPGIIFLFLFIFNVFDFLRYCNIFHIFALWQCFHSYFFHVLDVFSCV